MVTFLKKIKDNKTTQESCVGPIRATALHAKNGLAVDFLRVCPSVCQNAWIVTKQSIGVAKIFPAEVHSILQSKVDDFFCFLVIVLSSSIHATILN